MKKVGFTTSVPVEIIFAADKIPVDLNNIFITDGNSEGLVEKAENEGFPRNTCAWIKGMYSSVLKHADIDTIIGVIEGDCSNTRALQEVFEMKGVTCIPFGYPQSRDYDELNKRISSLCEFFGIELDDCIEIKKKLDDVRKKLVKLDDLTWRDNKATGFENHIWQVSSSDFNGNFVKFDEKLSYAIDRIEKREPLKESVRLGFIGVPPIMTDIFDFVEKSGARIVYNEVQRQFTMADSIGNTDITATYLNFTYPYGLNERLEDIKKNSEIRKLDGIIHYTQSFCFRGIENIVIKNELETPVLNLEGDGPGKTDARTRLRIEAFIDMLKG